MKKTLLILIPLIIALTLRLYPTSISGMPFSVDAWPLIKNTELLIQNTPIPLYSNVFDGYNNFWPASSLFAAILSQITNVPPIYSMALGIPIVAALTIPIFYILVKKITENNKIALIASVLLAAAFPYALFTAGVTKETFASPIYIALILLFLVKHNWKTTLLFSATSIALVLSHHLSAFFAVVIISSLSIAFYSFKASKDQKTNSNKSNILFIAIISTVTALYFVLFAFPGFTVSITASTVLTVGAYQIFVIALTLYHVYIAKNFSRIRTLFNCALAFLLIFVFMLLITKIPLLAWSPNTTNLLFPIRLALHHNVAFSYFWIK